MSTASAIILAAGHGSRMGPLTADRPKAMLEVDGQPLIDWQLDALAAHGVFDVTMVVGYQQQRLRDHLKRRVRFIDNARYDETNSLYSLSLAREPLARGAVVMNADVLVSREILGRLIAAPVEDAVLVDTNSALADEEMKVRIWQGFAVDFSKELPASEAHAENLGVLKFGASGGRRLVAHIDALIAAGHERSWAPMAFRALAQEWPLRVVAADGLPWTEIDFPADLERARDVVAPAIGGAAWRRAA
jgi:choline kinase